MKLLLENWRNYLNEGWEEEARKQAKESGEDTSPGLNTVGDLRKVWRMRRAGELTSDFARRFPGADVLLAAKDIGSLFKKLYSSSDDFVTQSGLDAINVDDKVSRIVDDKIELAFLRGLVKQFEKMPDDQPLGDIKTTQMIQDFIAKKFGGTTVKK
tara:strand:- start:355 stop:822 length:468 start_codon:yes stop_codon:yes gene_type:complete